MPLDVIPAELRERYRIEERHHAVAILTRDFPEEFEDLIACLQAFVLRHSYISKSGKNRSDISDSLDGYLQEVRGGWAERHFDVRRVVDGVETSTPTHKIDNVKNRVGVEVEWNNKTEFFDRDLNNFRLLWEYDVLSVGVIITRLTELQQVFKAIGRGKSYGASTTHWDKLIPKVDGGGAGGCPLLLVGMGVNCYDPNS